MKHIKKYESIKDLFYGDGSDQKEKLKDLEYRLSQIDNDIIKHQESIKNLEKEKEDYLNQKRIIINKLANIDIEVLNFAVKLSYSEVNTFVIRNIYVIIDSDRNNVNALRIGSYIPSREIGVEGLYKIYLQQDINKIAKVTKLKINKPYSESNLKLRDISSLVVIKINDGDFKSQIISELRDSKNKDILNKIYSYLNVVDK